MKKIQLASSLFIISMLSINLLIDKTGSLSDLAGQLSRLHFISVNDDRLIMDPVTTEIRHLDPSNSNTNSLAFV